MGGKKLANLLNIVCFSALMMSIMLFVPQSMAAAEETLKVGCTLPLNLGMGIETKKALEILVSELNEAGGLKVQGKTYRVDLTIYDDKYRPDAGRAAVERLVYEDKVKFMTCQIGSGPTLAGLTITEPEKIATFANGASTKLVSAKNLYTFGTSITRTSIVPLWIKVKKIFPEAKSVVNLSPDDETGRARSRMETKIAQALGIKVLDTIFYPRKTQDFAPFATKIMELKPDLVDYPGAVAGTQLGLQLKALYEAGFRGGHISAMSLKMDEISAVTPKKAMQNILAPITATEVENPSDMAGAFKRSYINKYGKWSTGSVAWLLSWFAFVEAVQKADSVDPEKVAHFIAEKGLEWESTTCRARMVRRPDLKNPRYCDTCGSLHYIIIKNGEPEYLGVIPLDEIILTCEKIFGGTWR